MDKKAVAFCSMVLIPNLCWGMNYTWETPTVNDWKIVIANGNLNYNNDAVIGNNGTSTAPEPAAISIEKGGKATINSPGTIHIIGRPTPVVTPPWMYGIYAYSSTGGSVKQQTTIATINTALDIDVETATRQRSGDESLGSALEVTAHGTNGVNTGDNAVTQVQFNKAASLKVVNRAIDTDSGLNSNSMEGINLLASEGGRNELTFNDELEIQANAALQGRNIYGVRYEDHNPNGKGSLLTFNGNTSIEANALHGGRVWGFLAQAAGGTHTLTTASGTNFQVTVTQHEGKNFAEGIKFNSRQYGSDSGNQTVDIKGKVQAIVTGDYYANAFGLNASNQSRQQIYIGDDAEFTAASDQFAYAMILDYRTNSVNQTTFDKNLNLLVSTPQDGYGIEASAKTKGNGSFSVNGKTSIKISSQGNGYGVYSRVNDGHQHIQFNKGLTILLQSQQKSSVALNAKMDQPSIDANNYIQVEGETRITTPENNGFVAFADGKGSHISINKNKQDLSQLIGNSTATNAGHIEMYAMQPTSSYTGNIFAYNDGINSLYISGKDSTFTGTTWNTFNSTQPGTVSIGIQNSAIWNVTKDATLSNLDVSQGGLVNLAYKEDFQTLLTKNLSGENGKFLLDIDASTNTNNSDILLITNNFTGTHTLALHEVGHGNLDGAEGTVLAKVNHNNGIFLAQDEEGTLYWHRYLLDKRDTTDTSGVFTTDWYLKKVVPLDDPSTTVITTVTNAQSAYTLWQDTLDTLLQRMGELRFAPENKQDGIWFRSKGGQVGYRNTFDYTTKYHMYQLGYDTISKKDEDGVTYQGLALGYSEGDTSFHIGSGKSRISTFTIYNTDIRTLGHYLDVLLSLSVGKYDTTAFNTRVEPIQTNYNGMGFLASVEYGRKKQLKNNWYIEPQAQFTFGFMDSENYVTNQNVQVHQSSIKSAVGRIGINLGRQLSNKSIAYARLHLLHEFGGKYQIALSDDKNTLVYDGNLQRTWMKYGIGFAKTMSNNNSMYFDIENAIGNHTKKHWTWNVGVRHSF